MFIYNPDELKLSSNERSIVNAMIYNSVKNYNSSNEFFISFSEIDALLPLVCYEHKTLFYSFLDYTTSRKLDLPIFDSDNEEILFNTSVFSNFELGGKVVNKKLTYKYSLEDKLFNFISTKSVQKTVLDRLSPVESGSLRKIEFINELTEKEKSVLLSLIQTHYLDYYDSKLGVYKTEYTILIDALNLPEVTLRHDITLQELKFCLSKFTKSSFWLYLYNDKIPSNCSLISSWFIYEYDENPFVSYKYSSELLSLLRDHNFINDYLVPIYKIDSCDFKTIQEIEGIDF